jgi:uncharacterized coiled-coil protein SlyX
MNKESLTKHIESRIDELSFFVASHKAVYDAAKKFDGKVLNKRIDSLITENIRAEGFPKAFGRYSKDYLTKFRAYNPIPPHGHELSFYIESEDILDNRFQFSVWAARQDVSKLEEQLNKLFQALKNLDAILEKYETTMNALKSYEEFLETFGLYACSDELKIS